MRSPDRTMSLLPQRGAAALALLVFAIAPLAADEPKAGAKHAQGRANLLARETSPYLLQHAHNPVNWRPWGPEALAKAKEEGKLIFLSIGYSSCHWCHVMERESFSDEEIAALLNEHYICIKVDREERPDIDAIYMQALQTYNRMIGSKAGGGWPLSMFLTPDARPFFGGTYFAARDGDRPGATGFLTIARKVQELWKKSPDKIREDAETLTKVVKAQLEESPVNLTPLDKDLVQAALDALGEQYDAAWGGFGYVATQPNRPKFPEPSNLMLLLEQTRHGDKKAKEMLLGTLEHMALGGIRDHLGGGFHRYSTDRFWRIPHFEKMLYDNAQLASVYAEAAAMSDRADFRRVVVELLTFVEREMTSPEGAFYAALDADSEGEEGKFYRWTQEEVRAALTEEEHALFAPIYGLEGPPNFEDEFYVPQLSQPLAEHAARLKITEAELEERLVPLRRKLLEVRGKRVRPLTDTKILASWNGQMIRGFADAGRLLDEPKYIDTARRAAEFVLSQMRTKEGRLLRTYSRGEAKLNAYVNDYAFLANGLIALHRATNDDRWLKEAEAITQKQIELFWDEKGGGFHFTSGDHEALLAREKNVIDSALPSGNSISAENLLYLAEQRKDDALRDRARRTVQSAAWVLKQAPSAAPWMAASLAKLLEP